jgi:hypothetical protein
VDRAGADSGYLVSPAYRTPANHDLKMGLL